MKAIIVSAVRADASEVRAVCFTAKQAERLRALLEVAEQSTDIERDTDLIDRLAWLFN